MIEYRSYNAAGLRQLINSEEFKQYKHVPISTVRALAHLANPRLNEEFDLICVAYYNGEVAGYQLILCDHLYTPNGIESIGWLSCIWVDDNMRGKGIGRSMFEASQVQWKDRLFFTNSMPISEGMFSRTGQFQGPAILEGTRLYMRFNSAYLLPNKKPSLNTIKPLLQLADGTLNLVQDIRLNSFRSKLKADYIVLPEIDDVTAAFIDRFQQQELFRRGQKDLNWIVEHPWLHTGEQTDEDRKYFFSSHAEELKIQHVVIQDPSNKANEPIAYMLLFIRDGQMRLPYLYFDEVHAEKVAQVALQLMLKNNVDMFTTFHPVLSKYFANNPKPAIFVKSITRRYFGPKKYGDIYRTGINANFTEGDGDQSFT